jgi:hypothetical protein
MDNQEFLPNDGWDEYRWEKYLRENDQRCDRFAALLEANLAHPDRDQVIAREMGWHHLLEGGAPADAVTRGAFFLELIDHMLAGEELGDETHSGTFVEDGEEDFGAFPEGVLGFGTPAYFSEDDERLPEAGAGKQTLGHVPLPGGGAGVGEGIEDIFNFDDDEDDDDEDISSHPLCDLAATYQAWLERLIQEEPEWLLDPMSARLTAYSAICGAKVCAALDCDEFEDLGMTIAYLKRGLKAINIALECTANLAARGVINSSRAEELRNRVFKIRDGIIELMGYYRMEWMRRIDE